MGDDKSGRSAYRPDDTTILKSPSDDEESGVFSLAANYDLQFVEATARYEILDEIGQGGVGTVYRGRDRSLGREVAIKMLLPKHIGSPELIQRFTNESRIIGYLQHPGIAHVFEAGHCLDGRPFYTMKLVDGETLADLRRQHGERTVPLTRLLRVFSDVCHAVAYTHAMGLIHLDLKPRNVMVGSFGEVHVMDWGLATAVREDVAKQLGLCTESRHFGDSVQLNLDKRSSIRGTLPYMSPEMARGERVGRPADIFGLGAILCEILTGSPPFTGNTKREMFRQALSGEIGDALASLEASDTDDALIRLTKRCLAPLPEDRPESAHELVSELSNYTESALARMESDMSQFFDLSLDLFCIAGFDGYFRRINPNFSKVLGFPDSVLLATPFIDFVHEEDREKTVLQMSVLKDGKPVVRFRNRYISIDGDYFQFEWTAKSIPDEHIIFAVARIVT